MKTELEFEVFKKMHRVVLTPRAFILYIKLVRGEPTFLTAIVDLH